ncbi:MAG: ABC transporter permease [Phycisphaeraceae bacterium]|nr:MAG: ABC transporter permease [Phycisphaeraceae bacterium]
MNLIALRMLTGDRAKYFGILVGLAFASLLITQQGAIFLGLASRTYQFVADTPQADLWVMDPQMQHHSDGKQMLETTLARVRGVEGVAWAVPMYRAFAQLRLPDGTLRTCLLNGVDDATLTGLPGDFAEGSPESLRHEAAVAVDLAAVAGKLSVSAPGGGSRPLMIGDQLELNERRGVVSAVYRQRPGFFWDPTLYTTFSRAKQFSPGTRRQLTFVLVKVRDGASVAHVQRSIAGVTGMACRTSDQFAWKTAVYILTQTGILINFAIAVLLGFMVGAAIAGQTFYNFVNDNLRYFAALKAIGASDRRLAGMVAVQALTAAACGYGLGAGAAAFFGHAVGEGLAFFLPWHLLVFGAVSVVGIAAVSAVIGIRKLKALEPATVFKS